MTILQNVQNHKDDITATIAVPNIENHCQRLTEKAERVQQQLEARRRKLPAMKQYLVNRTSCKEHVDWLTEVNAVLQESFVVDNLENAETEVETHGAINMALLNSKETVEEVIANAGILKHGESSVDPDEKPNVLKELWTGAQKTASRKTNKLEEILSLWTSYEKDSEWVMSCLTKGEMVLTQVKSIQENKKDVLLELLDKVEVGVSLLASSTVFILIIVKCFTDIFLFRKSFLQFFPTGKVELRGK